MVTADKMEEAFKVWHVDREVTNKLNHLEYRLEGFMFNKEKMTYLLIF